MKVLTIKSNIFEYNKSSTLNKIPNNFLWDFKNNIGELDFYIDGDIHKAIIDKNNGRKKILWTMESPFYNHNVFEFIIKNLDLVLQTFELIFTYNEDLLPLSNKFKWVPAMGFWVKEPKIHEKTKLVSMITSDKKDTPQQQLRYKFALENKQNLDLFGKGHNPIVDKESGLNDYMFSVCIENAIFDTYFTEKILDCFATGTIPIYSGTKKISKYFNVDGIIFLDGMKIEDLNESLYYKKLNSVKENFNLCLNYDLPENYFMKNYLN